MFKVQKKTRNGGCAYEQRCPSFKAFFRLTPDKRVRIFFLKRHLPPEVIQRHFSKGQFEMPVTFELPSMVLLKLGIEHYKIQTGCYPIQEDHDFIRVDF